MKGPARWLILLGLAAVGIAVIVVASRREPSPPDGAALTWVAAAHQLGPVGYRDPAGAISPDGRWIAYSEGRFLRVRPAGGGPSVALPAADAQIRNLTWSPDSERIPAAACRWRALASDGRSLEQDAAGMVARRKADGVHRVELRRAVLEDPLRRFPTVSRIRLRPPGTAIIRGQPSSLTRPCEDAKRSRCPAIRSMRSIP